MRLFELLGAFVCGLFSVWLIPDKLFMEHGLVKLTPVLLFCVGLVTGMLFELVPKVGWGLDGVGNGKPFTGLIFAFGLIHGVPRIFVLLLVVTPDCIPLVEGIPLPEFTWGLMFETWANDSIFGNKTTINVTARSVKNIFTLYIPFWN